MRRKVIFGFLLFSFMLPLAHTSGGRDRSFDRYEATVYKVEDAFFFRMGISADGAHFLTNVFLSFDVTGERWDVDLQAMIAESHLHIALINYMSGVFFPIFEAERLVEILEDEENTLFSDGFMEYIRDNEDLSNTRVTSVRIELVDWAR